MIAAVALVVAGVASVLVFRGGAGADYLRDARPAASILADLDDAARFLTISLMSNHIYAKVLKDDGAVVEHRYDGRMPRSPAPSGKAGDGALARRQSFTLADVDFAVVAKISRHARKRVAGASLQQIVLQRALPNQADLLWTVMLKDAGDHRLFHYTLAGEPLVDQALDFVALEPKDVPQRFEKALGANARVVAISLARDHAFIEVMAPKSSRDTDGYRFGADGVVSAPSPQTSDGDAAALDKAVFTFGEVDWAAVRRAGVDAAKHLDATVQGVTIRRHDVALGLAAHGRTERGATRTVHYDAAGKRLGE